MRPDPPTLPHMVLMLYLNAPQCVYSLIVTDGISGQLFQTFLPLAAVVFTYLYSVGRRRIEEEELIEYISAKHSEI